MQSHYLACGWWPNRMMAGKDKHNPCASMLEDKPSEHSFLSCKNYCCPRVPAGDVILIRGLATSWQEQALTHCKSCCSWCSDGCWFILRTAEHTGLLWFYLCLNTSWEYTQTSQQSLYTLLNECKQQLADKIFILGMRCILLLIECSL